MADSQDVVRLAALSRIEVPEAELTAFAKDFDSVVSYIGQLDELSLSISETPALPLVHNAYRDDGTPDASRTWSEALIAQFPSRDGDTLSVKKIIVHE